MRNDPSSAEKEQSTTQEANRGGNQIRLPREKKERKPRRGLGEGTSDTQNGIGEKRN